MDFIVARSDAAQVVEEFCAVYPPQVLVNGVYYYEQSRVVDVTVAGRIVSAKVLGEAKHLVTLHLDFAHLNSTCDCGQEGFCEHIAAVAFTLFAKHGEPRICLEQRNSAARKLTPTVQKTTSPPGRSVKQAVTGAASGSPERDGLEKPLSLAEDEGLQGWIRCLENIVEWRYERQNRTDLRDLHYRMDEWLRSAAHWERKNRTLLTVVVGLIVIREANKMLLRDESSEDLYPFMGSLSMAPEGNLFHMAMDHLHDAARSLYHDSLRWLRLWDVSSLAQLVRSVLLHPKDSGTHLTAFTVAWSWLLFHVTEPQDEIERLQVQKRKAQKSDAALVPSVKQAIAFLYILCHEDNEARAELADVGLAAVVLVVPLFDAMQAHHDRERLYRWLQFISPRLDPDDWSQRDLIYEAANQWIALATQLPQVDEECFAFLKSAVEVVYEEWEEYLIKTSRYEVFVDYYLALGLSLGEAKPEHLRRIENKAPHALLAYYHQLIETYIQEKKRDSYRSAARLLTDLRTLYRRQKRMPDWESFLTRLVERHGRLRALMEEMQKGGLVS